MGKFARFIIKTLSGDKEDEKQSELGQRPELVKIGETFVGLVPILLITGAVYQFSILLSINATRYFSWGQTVSDSATIVVMASAIILGMLVADWIIKLPLKKIDWLEKLFGTNTLSLGLHFVILPTIAIVILVNYENIPFRTAWFFYAIFYGLGGFTYSVLKWIDNGSRKDSETNKPWRAFLGPIFFMIIPPITVWCCMLYGATSGNSLIREVNKANYAQSKNECGEIRYMNDQFIFLSGGTIIKNADNGDVVFLAECPKKELTTPGNQQK